MGQVVALPSNYEPWLTKRQLASHLGFSRRWIDYRVLEGMPSKKIGGKRMFKMSDVELWFNDCEQPK